MNTSILKELALIKTTTQDTSKWFYLSWNDIKSRYRRTVIGPFWLVIANAITILGMAVVWSLLFKMNIKDYMPRLTAAMTSWTFIAYTFIEAPTTFIQARPIIQNLPTPLYLHPLRLVARNFITFLHNLLMFFVVAVAFGLPFNRNILLFFPFLLIVLFNFFFISITLGLIGARFRDFPQIVTAVLSVLVFVTPVMWDPQMLGDHYILAYLNPFTYVLHVIKMPLLGQIPDKLSICGLGVITVVNVGVALLMIKKLIHRIPFWV